MVFHLTPLLLLLLLRCDSYFSSTPEAAANAAGSLERERRSNLLFFTHLCVSDGARRVYLVLVTDRSRGRRPHKEKHEREQKLILSI